MELIYLYLLIKKRVFLGLLINLALRFLDWWFAAPVYSQSYPQPEPRFCCPQQTFTILPFQGRQAAAQSRDPPQ
jgi:hypothetical protein